MRGVLDEYESVQDEEGDLNEVVNRCVVGLGQCLNAIDAPLRRQHIVRALFDVYLRDVEFGGIDIGYPARDLMLKAAAIAPAAPAVTSVRVRSSDWRNAWHGIIFCIN